jgi:2-phosphoglycerate kinase
MSQERAWHVLLLGGASGVGKTSISYRLAHHYGVGLTEVDDFQVVLEGLTTAEQYPVLHYWRTHYEEARRMDDDAHLDFMRRYSEVMADALTLVIANHIESRAPVVLEGDFILPSLAIQSMYGDIPADGQVRAVFLYEDDEEQIARNYLLREGQEQPRRARISWRVSEWLRSEAERLGVPTLPARPWDTVLERAIAVVDAGSPLQPK